MGVNSTEMTVRDEGYKGIDKPASVLKKWRQAKIQELKSTIFSGKSSLKDIEIQIERLQQQKEDLEFGKKPQLEGHIEMMELQLQELKDSINV